MADFQQHWKRSKVFFTKKWLFSTGTSLLSQPVREKAMWTIWHNFIWLNSRMNCKGILNCWDYKKKKLCPRNDAEIMDADNFFGSYIKSGKKVSPWIEKSSNFQIPLPIWCQTCSGSQRVVSRYFSKSFLWKTRFKICIIWTAHKSFQDLLKIIFLRRKISLIFIGSWKSTQISQNLQMKRKIVKKIARISSKTSDLISGVKQNLPVTTFSSRTSLHPLNQLKGSKIVKLLVCTRHENLWLENVTSDVSPASPCKSLSDKIYLRSENSFKLRTLCCFNPY
jgi:hypothetical protein